MHMQDLLYAEEENIHLYPNIQAQQSSSTAVINTS